MEFKSTCTYCTVTLAGLLIFLSLLQISNGFIMNKRSSGRAHCNNPLHSPALLKSSTYGYGEEPDNGTPLITFVTGNTNKLQEVRMIVASALDSAFEVTNMELDLPEFQGDPETISKEKCKMAAQQVGGPVIVEDTSLCFNGIGGMPGPYVKWFHQAVGNRGMYRMLEGFEDRTGYAQCALSFALGPGHEPQTFIGVVNGHIVEPGPDNDFGWDPIFQPNGYSTCFSGMPKSEKNKISHRSQALSKFKDYLEENPHILDLIKKENTIARAKSVEKKGDLAALVSFAFSGPSNTTLPFII